MTHLTTALDIARDTLERVHADDDGRLSIVGIIIAVLAVIGLFAVL